MGKIERIEGDRDEFIMVARYMDAVSTMMARGVRTSRTVQKVASHTYNSELQSHH